MLKGGFFRKLWLGLWQVLTNGMLYWGSRRWECWNHTEAARVIRVSNGRGIVLIQSAGGNVSWDRASSPAVRILHGADFDSVSCVCPMATVRKRVDCRWLVESVGLGNISR